MRANFERSLAVARADPPSLADEALAKLVFGDHPFGRLAARGPARGLRHRGCCATSTTGNFGARRTHIYVAGRYDRAALEAALRKAFGDWREGPAADQTCRRAERALQLSLIDSPGAPQSSLRIAVARSRPGEPVYFQTTLMNSLLGGTFGSRITDEHPRGQGLQLLAGFLHQRAPRRRTLDR